MVCGDKGAHVVSPHPSYGGSTIMPVPQTENRTLRESAKGALELNDQLLQTNGQLLKVPRH